MDLFAFYGMSAFMPNGKILPKAPDVLFPRDHGWRNDTSWAWDDVYCGDGLIGHLVDNEASAPNLLCVIDYNDNDPAFTGDSVEEMADIAELIIEAVPMGIDIDFEYVPISTSPPTWNFSNIHETRKLLRDLQRQGG